MQEHICLAGQMNYHRGDIMSDRTWQDNAAEFALLDKGEGWPFARLIACSVQQLPHGGGSKSRLRLTPGKTGAREFAGQAHTSTDRVLRYLAAWNKAADRGLCTSSHQLYPSDVPITPEPDAPWADFYSARKPSKQATATTTTAEPEETIVVEPEDVEPAAEPDERDPFAGTRTVERLPIEASILRQSHAHGHISEKIHEALNLLRMVNHDWSDYEGSIPLLLVHPMITELRVEIGLLEFAAGIETPMDHWRPEQ